MVKRPASSSRERTIRPRRRERFLTSWSAPNQGPIQLGECHWEVQGQPLLVSLQSGLDILGQVLKVHQDRTR